MKNFWKILDLLVDPLMVIILFVTIQIKGKDNVNYLEWIAIILCFILLRLNRNKVK